MYLSGETTLYAVWAAHTFVLRYDANGGSGSMSDVIVTYGINTPFSTSTFTKSGYTQVGWYKYRSSDNKWQYVASDGATKGWFVDGTQPSGYSKFVASTTSSVSEASAVQDDVVILYAVWQSSSSGGSNSGSGSSSGTLNLDGKKILFIGNSFVYYGGAVEHGSQKKADKGWFYQICKANGDDVTVYDCTYGSHHLYDFNP